VNSKTSKHRLVNKCTVPAVIAIVTFSVYNLTLMPTVGWSDSAELSVKAHELGVPHGSGYPIYAIFAWAFTKLPVGDIAFRVNLLSAVFGAIAAVIVYYIVLELTDTWWSGFVASLAFAFSFSEWSQSTIAEVYTLNSLIISLCVLSLILWQKGRIGLEYFALFFGLSQAHHRTSILLAIPFSAFIVLRNSHIIKQPRYVAKLFLIMLIPQISYFYLLIRGKWSNWQSFFEYVAYGHARECFHWFASLGEVLQRIENVVWPLAKKDYGVAIFGIGAIGIIILLSGSFHLDSSYDRKEWKRIGILFFTSWLSSILFCLVFHADDLFVFMIPSALFIALGVGIATYAIVHAISRHIKVSISLFPLVIVLFAMAPVSLLLAHYRSLDRSKDFHFRDNGRIVLEKADSNATIFTEWGACWPLFYLQRTKNLRADVDIQVLGKNGVVDIDGPEFLGHPIYFWSLRPTDSQIEQYNLYQVPVPIVQSESKLYAARLPQYIQKENIVWEETKWCVGKGSRFDSNIFDPDEPGEWFLHPDEELRLAQFTLPFKNSCRIESIGIEKAGTDVSTKDSRIVIELKGIDNKWVLFDELQEKNIGLNVDGAWIGSYFKRLPSYFPAVAIRVTLIGRGWFRIGHMHIRCASGELAGKFESIAKEDIEWKRAEWLVGENSVTQSDILDPGCNEDWMLSPCRDLHCVQITLPFDAQYGVKWLGIGKAGSEGSIRNSRIKIELKNPNGGWMLLENIREENIGWNVDGIWHPRYFKSLPNCVPAAAIRFEMFGTSWFRLGNIQIRYL